MTETTRKVTSKLLVGYFSVELGSAARITFVLLLRNFAFSGLRALPHKPRSHKSRVGEGWIYSWLNCKRSFDIVLVMMISKNSCSPSLLLYPIPAILPRPPSVFPVCLFFLPFFSCLFSHHSQSLAPSHPPCACLLILLLCRYCQT